MTKPKRKPIDKRWPGRHVLRFQLWRPLATISGEGPVSEALSDFLCAAFGKGTLTDDQVRRLNALRDELLS